MLVHVEDAPHLVVSEIRVTLSFRFFVGRTLQLHSLSHHGLGITAAILYDDFNKMHFLFALKLPKIFRLCLLTFTYNQDTRPRFDSWPTSPQRT